MRLIWPGALALCLLVSSPLHSQSLSGNTQTDDADPEGPQDQHNVRPSAGTGGNTMTDGIRLASVTIGQAATGRVNSRVSGARLGFWVPTPHAATSATTHRTTTSAPLRISPNPFSTSVTIAFEIHESTVVRAELFDLLGKSMGTLLQAPYPVGSHSLIVDGDDLPVGRYQLRLAAGSRLLVAELIRIR